jgi:hypothetical protein
MFDDIIITDHAISRFQEHLKYVNGKEATDPEATIRKLLAKAKPESIDPEYRLKRLLNHGIQESEYLVNSGWRFVITNGVLVTVERTKRGQN